MRIAKKQIGPGKPCYIIAEIGSNHDGDLVKAVQLVEAAASSGADAVKFQLFRAAHLYPPSRMKVETPAGKIDLYAYFKQVEIPLSWLPVLGKTCCRLNVHFLCTPFDPGAVRPLIHAGIDALKIASPEINHFPLLKAAARSGKPVILSSGISKLADVEHAVECLEVNGASDFAILQCVTAYPAPPEDSNLLVMETFRHAFGTPVGLSDHSLGIDVPFHAALIGMNILEKHFTLSRKDKGPDHSFAMEPEAFKRMVRKIRQAESMSAAARNQLLKTSRARRILGTGRKLVAASEAPLYICDSRSIYTRRAIPKGTRLKRSMLTLLRSERHNRPGLHPSLLPLVEGKRVARPLAAFRGLQWGDLFGETA